MADSQKASWEIAAKPRAKNRSRYAGGPGAGPDIMRIYSEFFVQAEDGRTSLDVLVLGATPELRDLTLERGHRVTTVDLSEKILADMTELLKARDDTREMRIVGNWLQLPLPDASIDIVVGDAIGNNIEFTNHHRLYGGIRTVLKSGGAFVCREVLGMCDSKRLTLVRVSTLYTRIISDSSISFLRFIFARPILGGIHALNRYRLKNRVRATRTGVREKSPHARRRRIS